MKNVLKSYRKIKKLPGFIYCVPALILKLMKVFFLRTRMIDPHHCIELSKFPFITVTWHNRLLFFPLMFQRKERLKTYALVSPSRDGQYLSDLLKIFGVSTVRGSSKKRGAIALNEAMDILNSGFTLSITPDGPRGPKYKMSRGPIILASKTGYPILPLSINASKYWQLRSWDNFQIPKPFSKVELVIGDFIKIPPDLTDAQIEKWQEHVEKKLMEISL